MARIAVADHPVTVRGIKDVFRTTRDLLVEGQIHRPGELLKVLERKLFSLLVYEIQIAGVPDGLHLLEQVRTRFPKTPVLVYTHSSQQDLDVRVLRSGASGFLHKENPEPELLKAVRKILSGDKYLPAGLEHRLALLHLERRSPVPNKTSLSDRELQVLKGLTEGKKLTQIGKKLSLSPKTVTAYRSRLLRKMGLHSNADLVHFVDENPHFV